MATNIKSFANHGVLLSSSITTTLQPPSNHTPALFRQHYAHTNLQPTPPPTMGNPTIDRHDATGFSRHRPLTPPEDCHSAQQREDDEVDTLAPKSPREDGELVMDMGPLSSSMPVARENNVHYTTSGDEGVQFPLPRQLTPVAHFDLLTSFDSSVLPSWDTMYVYLTHHNLEPSDHFLTTIGASRT